MPVTNTDSVLWYNVGEFGKIGYGVPNWSNDVGSLNPQILDWTYLVGRNLFHIMHHEDADLRIPPSINTVKRIHKLYIRAANILAGLDLTAGESLDIRDYDSGNPDYIFDPPIGPLPIVVEQHFAMDATGTLRMVFEADAWDSPISFTPGIAVAIGGVLEFDFADGTNLAAQIGRTFKLFDWTGVTRTGAFAISSAYAWDLSKLYTTGQVTLTSIPEPMTLLLLCFGSLAVLSTRKGR